VLKELQVGIGWPRLAADVETGVRMPAENIEALFGLSHAVLPEGRGQRRGRRSVWLPTKTAISGCSAVDERAGCSGDEFREPGVAFRLESIVRMGEDLVVLNV